eukprot:85578_1
MGQPLIPDHRLTIGWICLSIGCIFTIYCMCRLWLDFNKNTITPAPPKITKISANSASVSDISPKTEPQSHESIDSATEKSPSPNQHNNKSTNKKVSNSNVSTKLMRLTWCTLLCYLIFNLYVLISRLYVFVIKNDKVNFPCFIWVFPQITSFMSGRMFLYLLWCDRFCSVFNNSVFQKSDKFQYIMSIGIIGSMLLSIAFYLIIYALHADNHCQLSANTGHLFIAALPFTLFDLIWSVLILYLFVSHLSKTLNLSSNNNEYVKQKSRIYWVIKRLNVLVNISILSTWLILISIYNYMPLSASAIDGIINTICILLSLTKYEIIYNKMCFICINYYESCFMKFCCCCCDWCHKVNVEKQKDVTMLSLEVNN